MKRVLLQYGARVQSDCPASWQLHPSPCYLYLWRLAVAWAKKSTLWTWGRLVPKEKWEPQISVGSWKAAKGRWRAAPAFRVHRSHVYSLLQGSGSLSGKHMLLLIPHLFCSLLACAGEKPSMVACWFGTGDELVDKFLISLLFFFPPKLYWCILAASWHCIWQWSGFLVT